jgi:DNA-binding beta-propeller fold protein YncE
MKQLCLVLVLQSLLVITGFAAPLRYTCTPGHFEETPGGSSLGACHGGVVLDRAGNVYVTTDTKRGIVVFSADGRYLRSFGPSHIHALEIREEKGVEYLYAARPSRHEVTKLTLTGETVWTLGWPEQAGLYKDANGFNPCAVTVAPDGSIFVADGYGSNHVLKFDPERRFVKAFGGRGPEEGKFNTCHGIALDARQGRPLLFVCNRNNNRVEHWDLEGKLVRVLQKDLRMPAAVHIQGRHAVVPELQGRVTVLDENGAIVAQLGDNPNPKQRANYGLPRDQWSDGICNSPHGASMDPAGNLIVTEWSAFGRLQRFMLQK